MNDPFLEVLKTMLGGDLSDLSQWRLSLPVAGGMELDELLGPF